MSADFDPSKHQQPDYAREEAQSARTGLSVVLLVCCTLGASVQAISRVPGTSGVIYIPAFLLCVFVQFSICSVELAPPAKPDLIHPAIAVLVQFALCAVLIIRTFIMQFRGYPIEIHHFGLGILHRWMPNSSFFKIGFASDMVVGVGLATLLYFTGSPRLGSWYYIATFGLLFVHMWIDWMERQDMQRMRQAQQRARAWNQRLNRMNRG